MPETSCNPCHPVTILQASRLELPPNKQSFLQLTNGIRGTAQAAARPVVYREVNSKRHPRVCKDQIMLRHGLM